MNLRSEEGLRRFIEANEGNVAFLRFARGGLSQGKFSDWDIAVRDRGAALKACDSLYGGPWLRVPRRYVIQHYYQWGQCDLLPVFEWNGFEYLSQELFWEKVGIGDDGVPRPALGHDAYIAWMTGLLWGRSFNRRYRKFIQRAAREDVANFREALDAAFGKKLGGKLYRIAERGDGAVATHWVDRMHIALVVRRGMMAPFETLGGVTRQWWCELKFHLRLPFPWIALLGPDGSGKSTIIESLEHSFRYSRIKMRVVHWVPKFKDTGKNEQILVDDPHAKPPKGKILSLLQLLKIVFLWWYSTVTRFIHFRAKRGLLVSDRFYSDLIADPLRYRYGASSMWARLAFALIPKPDKVIVLLASAETIGKRKQEVSAEELERQIGAYRNVGNAWGRRGAIVDCDRSPEEVAEEVEGLILKEMRKRSR